MVKYTYKIDFNNFKQEYNNVKKFDINYGNTKNINIYIQKNESYIEFSMTKKYKIDEIIEFKNKLFREIFRKVHLFYILMYGAAFNVKNIKITINSGDNIIEESNFNKNDNRFPFMFSMIKNKKLSINNDFSFICELIKSDSKTKQDKDSKFSALSAFLLGNSRTYELDKFLNYWTAINSVENFIVYKFINSLLIESKVNNDEMDFFKLNQNFFKFDKAKNDLLKYLLDDYKFDGIVKQDKKNDLKLINETEIFLKSKNILEKKDLNNFVINIYNNGKLNDDKKSKDDFTELVINNGYSLKSFFLIKYPYIYRCKYIHGEKASNLLSAFNDNDIVGLKVINHFLEIFLKKSIIDIFNFNPSNELLGKYNVIYEKIKRYLFLQRCKELTEFENKTTNDQKIEIDNYINSELEKCKKTNKKNIL